MNWIQKEIALILKSLNFFTQSKNQIEAEHIFNALNIDLRVDLITKMAKIDIYFKI